jgi:hypothetical protein
MSERADRKPKTIKIPGPDHPTASAANGLLAVSMFISYKHIFEPAGASLPLKASPKSVNTMSQVPLVITRRSGMTPVLAWVLMQ